MIRRRLAIFSATALALMASAGMASGSTVRTRDTTLTGAGSSFVFPLVSVWTPLVKTDTGIALNYNPIGSGAGIAAISNRSVDLGASDAPLTPDQEATCSGCLTIPWAFSGTAIAYQGEGLPAPLRITGKVLADIYLGKISNWSDPAIKKLNKGVRLPNKRITPIFRSDASGTSYNFTEYLSKVSSEWKGKVGVGTQPAFPTGVGGAKSSGVSALLAKTDGGITYVDVAYALQSHFKLFAVQNSAGKFVTPGLRQIRATAATVKTAKPKSNGLVLSVVDPSKKALTASKKLTIAYPICTFTYVIVPKQAKQAAAVKTLLRWALTKGQADSVEASLRFVAIPKVVQQQSLKLLTLIKQA
jgi:phosphate transport system substrate-binding protein